MSSYQSNEDLHANWFPPGKRFPHPDWDSIAKWVQSQPSEAEVADLWEKIFGQWMAALVDAFGEGYRGMESPHFHLISVATEKKANEMLDFLERCLVDIQNSLPFLEGREPVGACPVIVVQNTEDFYAYLSEYVEGDGAFGAVGGVYLNRGYGHFVMPSTDLAYYVDVFAHELCHACVAELALPAWLDEAIAVTIENRITGRNPYVLDREMVWRHQEYWTEDAIRGFWRGESFWYADEGQELSYHLAQFLLSAIYQGGHTPTNLINEFVVAAAIEDAGVTAAREVLGMDLPAVLQEFLGEGNWEPEHLASDESFTANHEEPT